MAASVLLALVVAGGLWLSVPGPSLAADVVTHMAGEPEAWRRTDVPVPAPDAEDVLRNSQLRLAAGAGIVSYATSCEFRGHRVPHLVIQTASGPVTVMVLVHEQVAKSVQFDEQGYRGVIVPCPATAVSPCSRTVRRRISRPSNTSRPGYSIPSFGPVDPERPAPQIPTSPSKSTSRRALAARVG